MQTSKTMELQLLICLIMVSMPIALMAPVTTLAQGATAAERIRLVPTRCAAIAGSLAPSLREIEKSLQATDPIKQDRQTQILARGFDQLNADQVLTPLVKCLPGRKHSVSERK